MEPLGCFVEQVCPGIQKEGLLPGHTFIQLVESLSKGEATPGEQRAIAYVFNRLSSLPNQGFIELVGIFERDIMHG